MQQQEAQCVSDSGLQVISISEKKRQDLKQNSVKQLYLPWNSAVEKHPVAKQEDCFIHADIMFRCDTQHVAFQEPGFYDHGHAVCAYIGLTNTSSCTGRTFQSLFIGDVWLT